VRSWSGIRPTQVIHIGPHPLTVGGTQSVMRTITDFNIGADKMTVRPTWNGPRHLLNCQLVRRAAGSILRADRNTIIHLHLSNGGAYVRDGPLAALARARGLRVVISIHGFDFPGFSEAHPLLVGSIVSRAHGILCLSAEAEKAVHGLNFGGEVRTLANPVTIDEHALPASATEPIVLFAGTIGLRKGVDVLVEAWRLLLDRGIDAHCRLVGPIDDYRPPVLDRMSVEQSVDPRAIRPLIRTSRVVTLPSRAEGMPMILTEALAAARPFVATPVGGTADLAPCQAMLVPVDDANALADAIGHFLTDPAAAERVGDRCRDFCRQTRGPEVIDAALREFYDAL
jgi:glycosyltransferase involved in cell wall biosynthesis